MRRKIGLINIWTSFDDAYTFVSFRFLLVVLMISENF